MNVRRQSTRLAFTLTELLVVTATVGILAALLFSAISQAKAKAQRLVCVNNLRQLGIAMKAFNADYSVYPLYANVDFSKGGYPEHHQVWDYALEYEELAISKGTNDFFATGVWHCPAAPRPVDYSTNSEWLTYGYNSYGLGAGPGHNLGSGLGIGGHRSAGTIAPPVNESEVVNPSEMMAIGEVFNSSPLFWRDANMANSKGASSRHQGKANVVFCDGHVESPTLQFLFTDTSDAALSRWNRDHQPHREKLSP
jgi:prepilin-type processing-associated H-X9-DG protein